MKKRKIETIAGIFDLIPEKRIAPGNCKVFITIPEGMTF